MLRLFDTHHIRPVQELDGLWQFTMEGVDKPYQMPVPGCWEQHPDFMRHRGRGVYRRNIYVTREGAVRLVFKGVSHTADVYLDGQHLAHHYNAFTPFEAIAAHVSAGWHTLEVRVDNTFGEHSALHLPNDYYTYGGITRPVAMELLPAAYVKQIHFTPYRKNGLWHGRTEVTLVNMQQDPFAARCSTELSDVRLEQNVLIPAGGECTIVFDSAYPNAAPWQPGSPALYLLTATLSCGDQLLDDLIERVGFRTVQVEGKKILLNGEPIFFKGFNRHEDYASFGCAIPLQLMVQDMDLMQHTGANAVRTCHYPNDERFLDLCDERGMLVWEENHARGLVLKDMLNPNFERQCEDCIREMLAEHFNHPAIVIWGLLNECASETVEGRAMYARQYAQIRSLDRSRPVTSATCRHFNDICLDLPDVVSYNIYSGWYDENPTEESNRREIEWIRSAGGEGKPLIVSEFGGGAVYGFRDMARSKWSEERQADILADTLSVYMNDPDISGVFIWQFADCRVTEDGGWFKVRPRTHNNKGIVDEYRRPKLAYATVKEFYSKH